MYISNDTFYTVLIFQRARTCSPYMRAGFMKGMQVKSIFWISASQDIPSVSFGPSIRLSCVLLTYVVYVESIFKISGHFFRKMFLWIHRNRSMNREAMKSEGGTSCAKIQPLSSNATNVFILLAKNIR